MRCWRTRCASATPISACYSAVDGESSSQQRSGARHRHRQFCSKTADTDRSADRRSRRSARVVDDEAPVSIADVADDQATRSDPQRHELREPGRRAHRDWCADAQGRCSWSVPSSIYRQEVRPFADKQIELFDELRRAGRHRHREHAAAQRIAANRWSSRRRRPDVLKVISQSPGELQPVFRGHVGECNAHLRGQVSARCTRIDGRRLRVSAMHSRSQRRALANCDSAGHSDADRRTPLSIALAERERLDPYRRHCRTRTLCRSAIARRHAAGAAIATCAFRCSKMTRWSAPPLFSEQQVHPFTVKQVPLVTEVLPPRP